MSLVYLKDGSLAAWLVELMVVEWVVMMAFVSSMDEMTAASMAGKMEAVMDEERVA